MLRVKTASDATGIVNKLKEEVEGIKSEGGA